MSHAGHHHEGYSVVGRHRESPWEKVPMEEAFRLIEHHMLEPLTHIIPTNLAVPGQVLAQNIISRVNIPEYPTSIKDGYAVIANDTSTTRRVVGARSAGDQGTIAPLQPGECIRVTTGSVMPEGADAVVMVERTSLVSHAAGEEELVQFNATVVTGQDIRQPGADCAVDDLILRERSVLGSAEIGLLTSISRRDIEIYRRPRVCVMSTGNEIVDCLSDEHLTPGQVRDSNRPQLLALLRQRGFKYIDAGICQDTYRALSDGIRTALAFAPILITTGGVSMGEKDFIKDVLAKEFGFKIHFGRVNMKPGMPATFATGQWNGQSCAVFALPGNPVSSWVCSELFAVPALRRLAGHPTGYQTELRVKLSRAWPLDARPEFVRAVLVAPDEESPDHLPTAVPTGSQASSRLQSLTAANLLLRLPPRSTELPMLAEGTVVSALVVGPI